jgi:hypothetical protein
MEIAVAQQFLRENENAVLATWRRDGRIQLSSVTVGLDGAGRAIISNRARQDLGRALDLHPWAGKGLDEDAEGGARIAAQIAHFIGRGVIAGGCTVKCVTGYRQ